MSVIHIYEAGTVVFAPTHSAQLCVGKILTLGLGQLGSKCPLSMPRLVSPQLLCSNGTVPLGPAIVFPTNNGEKHGESIFYAGEIVFGDVTPDDRRFARDAREEWFWRNLNSITRG